MAESPHVSDVRYTSASEAKAETGLLGYVSFLIDGSIRVDSVKVRRTQDGRLALSFPSRTDHGGREHPYLRPIDDATREAIERQVFRALGLTKRAR